MRRSNITSLRELLSRMTTQQLDGELYSENVDDTAVRMILGILREREKDIHTEEISQEINVAWNRYRENMARRESEVSGTKHTRNWLVRLASLAVALELVVSMIPH